MGWNYLYIPNFIVWKRVSHYLSFVGNLTVGSHRKTPVIPSLFYLVFCLSELLNKTLPEIYYILMPIPRQMPRKRDHHYWPLVWKFHRSPVDSPHEGPIICSFNVIFDINLQIIQWIGFLLLTSGSKRWRFRGPVEPPLHYILPGAVRNPRIYQAVRWGTHQLLGSRTIHREPWGVRQQDLLGLQHVLHVSQETGMAKQG